MRPRGTAMPATGRVALPLILIACTALAGCGGVDRDITLRKIRNTSNGPEEFTIVPGKPLEAPPNFVELPAPTPGGSNRTDQQPIADAVAALGGRPGALNDSGISAADGALVTAPAAVSTRPSARPSRQKTNSSAAARAAPTSSASSAATNTTAHTGMNRSIRWRHSASGAVPGPRPPRPLRAARHAEALSTL